MKNNIKQLAISLILILSCTILSAQSRITVKGTVSDEKGETLIGATVIVQGDNGKEPKATAITDIEGNYVLTCLDNDKLEFSYLGYSTKEVKINGRTKINVSLEPDSSTNLDEVVVIGYGSAKKKDLTGSVVSVKMSDIKSLPVSSVDQALQGRIAGADIMSTTGEPGATTSIRIRGTRSISASNEPLIVVDGVMDAIHDLNDINSADIESISVLKDASSTAIYGSRGSNGVIMITTKGGGSTNGRPNITFKADAGFSQLPRKLDIMNATEFALFRNEYASFMNSDGYDSITPETPIEDSSYGDPFSYGDGTDWIKEISRTAPYQDYNLSINGGTKKTRYFFSVNYNDNQGIIDNSGMQKLGNRVSIDHELFKWLKVGYKMNYTYRHNDNNLASIGGTQWWAAAQYLSPLIKPTDTFNPLYYSGQKINTPRAVLDLETNMTKRHSLNQTVYAEAKLADCLKLRSQFSYYLYERHHYRYQPSTLPRKKEGQGGDAYRGDWNEHSLSSETTLNFDKTWNKTHHFDALLGFTAYQYRGEDFNLWGSGYMVDENKWNNMNAVKDKETYSAKTSFSGKQKMSFLGRLNYNYKSRYYLTLTARYDGASNFANNNKWGVFPSAALKWTISNEPFMKNAKEVDDLSIRLSAGRSGNDAIGSYRSLAAMGTTTGGYLFGGSQPVAYYPSRLASPNLTWEKTDLYNLALVGSFFNSRLNVTAEAYYSKTTDLLLTIQTAAQTGYNSRFANIGATTNKGIELSIESRNIVKNNFEWNTNFTISHNDQVVDEIGTEDFVVAYKAPGNNSYMMHGYVKGYPLNAVWGFRYGGVWHNQEEIERNKATKAYAATGKYKSLGECRYYDINHDGILNQDDLCYLGNADPYIYGGLQNNFRIGNFNLGIYFTYSLGGKLYNYGEFYMAGSQFTNQYRYMLDAWHPTRNPDSDIPGVVNTPSHVPSDFLVHDASYIRLKNITVGYTFRFKKNKFIKDLKLSASGDNIYLWKNYNGFDPDVSSNSKGSTLRRMDLGAYPKPRTIIFSVQVRY